MFKIIFSLDDDRVCLFSSRCVESGWAESEETGMRRNGACPMMMWATSKWRAAALLLDVCVCRPCAGELLTVAAAGCGLSLDLDASNDGCGSRLSTATERWSTTRFFAPAVCQWTLMPQSTIHYVASGSIKSLASKGFPSGYSKKCVCSPALRKPQTYDVDLYLKRRLTNTPRRHRLDGQLLSLYPPSPSFSSFGAASVML